MSGEENIYAGMGTSPIPNRFWLDPRWQRRHVLVLGTCCAHDRMSERNNGQGCFMSQKTWAAKIKLDYTVLSDTLRDLLAWGYLSRERRGKGWTYRVRYTEADADFVRSMGVWRWGVTITEPGDSLSIDKLSGAPEPVPNGPGTPDSLAVDKLFSPTVCPENSQAHDFIEEPQKNILGEAYHLINSAEAAPSAADNLDEVKEEDKARPSAGVDYEVVGPDDPDPFAPTSPPPRSWQPPKRQAGRPGPAVSAGPYLDAVNRRLTDYSEALSRGLTPQSPISFAKDRDNLRKHLDDGKLSLPERHRAQELLRICERVLARGERAA